MTKACKGKNLCGMLKRDLKVIGLKCSVWKRYFKIQLKRVPVSFIKICWNEKNSLMTYDQFIDIKWRYFVASIFLCIVTYSHYYLWPLRSWRLLEVKNAIARAHFGNQLKIRFTPQHRISNSRTKIEGLDI